MRPECNDTIGVANFFRTSQKQRVGPFSHEQFGVRNFQGVFWLSVSEATDTIPIPKEFQPKWAAEILHRYTALTAMGSPG